MWQRVSTILSEAVALVKCCDIDLVWTLLGSSLRTHEERDICSVLTQVDYPQRRFCVKIRVSGGLQI